LFYRGLDIHIEYEPEVALQLSKDVKVYGHDIQQITHHDSIGRHINYRISMWLPAVA
jgi:hypothetical protein